MGLLKEEYKENKFENCFDTLYTKYTRVRRLRRDGNCFYRAFLYQLFEHLITSCHQGDETLYKQISDIVTKSKDELIAGGYEELVIGDFYDAFSEAIAGLPKVEKDEAKIEAHLLGLLGNNEGANYLIMFIRWLTALYLKQNAILYEVWVNGDIDGFCTREVE